MTTITEQLDAFIAECGGDTRDALNVALARLDAALAELADAKAENAALRETTEEYDDCPYPCDGCEIVLARGGDCQIDTTPIPVSAYCTGGTQPTDAGPSYREVAEALKGEEA